MRKFLPHLSHVCYLSSSAHSFCFTHTILTFALRPRYITGHAINIGMLGLSLVTTVFMICYCKWENRKRIAGGRDYRLQGPVDVGELGYKHPGFRYTI